MNTLLNREGSAKIERNVPKFVPITITITLNDE